MGQRLQVMPTEAEKNIAHVEAEPAKASARIFVANLVDAMTERDIRAMFRCVLLLLLLCCCAHPLSLLLSPLASLTTLCSVFGDVKEVARPRAGGSKPKTDHVFVTSVQYKYGLYLSLSRCLSLSRSLSLSLSLSLNAQSMSRLLCCLVCRATCACHVCGLASAKRVHAAPTLLSLVCLFMFAELTLCSV
jgi:hypothetical protein